MLEGEENRSEPTGKDRPGDADLAKEAEALKTGMMAERAKRQKAEIENAELRGELRGLSTKPAEATREFSRAELKRLVDDGKVSQEDADRTLDDQQGKRIERTVRETVDSTIKGQTQTQRMQSEIDRYKTALPDIVNEGSETRAKVEREYRYLTGVLGQPDSVVTELTALRAAFGDADRLVTGRVERETSQDVGSDAGPGSDNSGDGVPKTLTAREREFYKDRVGPGRLYPDWKSVEKELEFASPNLRKRMGAR